jgi:elongation factor Tu
LNYAKPHLTIALIGYGKTTLASQITKMSAARKLGVARSHQELVASAQQNKKRPPNFEAVSLWLESPKQTYTIIDPSGHQETIKNLISHAPLYNGLLWSTTSDVPSTQERELLSIAQQIGVRSVLVFLKVNPEESEEDIDAAEYLIRSALQRCNLDGNQAVIIRGDTFQEESVEALCEAMDTHFSPSPTADQTLLLPLERPTFLSSSATGRVFGRLERGTLRVGDKVEVLSSLAIRPATVSSLSAYPNTATSLNVANAEDFVQCTLSGVTQAEANQSTLIISPDRKTSRSMLTSRFSALVYHQTSPDQTANLGISSRATLNLSSFEGLSKTYQRPSGM